MTRLPKKITIYDIAREAGVSPATVSRIIKGSASVTPEKTERVRKIIEKYDFRPSAVAQALSQTRTRQIGMIVADALNPYYNTLYTAFDRIATQNGYTTLLCNNAVYRNQDDEMLTSLLAQRADAIIIYGGRSDLAERDPAYEALIRKASGMVPVILGSRLFGDMCSTVAVDHVRSMDLALDHLISLGHRDIGFMYAGDVFYGTRDKLNRFREILREKGLPVREEWLIRVEHYDAPSGQAGVERLMGLEHRPTALIGINDTVAAGMLQALTRHGVRVPQDVSLIGFDNIFLTELTTPTLSAVGYDYEQMAQALFDTAIAAIEGEEQRQTLVAPFLSAKASTAAPPAL